MANNMSNSALGGYTIDAMKQIFRQLDRDNNGVLSINDWKLVFKMMNVEVTDQEVAEIMQICDYDNSGSTRIEPTSFMSALVDATGGDAKDTRVSNMIHQHGLMNATDDQTEDIVKSILKPKYNNGIEIKAYHKGVTVDKLMQDNDSKSGLYEGRFILDSIMSANNIAPADILSAFDKCVALDQKLELKGLKDKPNHVPIHDFFKYAKISRGRDKFETDLQLHLDKENSGLIEYRQPLFRFYLVSNATRSEKVQFSLEVCDADDSGLIDFEELLQLLLLTHPIIMTKQDAIRIFKKADFLLNQFDVDNNHELDRNEYLAMAKKFEHLMFPNIE